MNFRLGSPSALRLAQRRISLAVADSAALWLAWNATNCGRDAALKPHPIFCIVAEERAQTGRRAKDLPYLLRSLAKTGC
jgi:hypothetical protein